MDVKEKARAAAPGVKRLLAALLAGAGLLAAALLLTGLGGAPAYRPLRIGVTLGSTGRHADTSNQQLHGFLLWSMHVNTRGGILGRPVQLLVRNDEGDPQKALKFYEEFIQEERVDLLFGPYSSRITQAVAPLAEKHGYPLISSGGAADRLWDSGATLLFGLYTQAGRYPLGFLELLLQQGLQRLAVMTFPGPFPEDAARGVGKWAERLGLALVSQQTFAGPDADLSVGMDRAQKSGAEAVLVCGYAQEAEAARRALDAAGWRPRAFFATVGPTLEGYGERLGPLAEGTFSSSLWEPTLPYEGVAQFTRDFQEQFGYTPSYHAAGAYAAGQILAQAVAKAGSAERRRVAEILAGLDAVSVIGRFGVDKRGVQTRHFPVVIQWQQGRKQIVWPREMATAEPRFN